MKRAVFFSDMDDASRSMHLISNDLERISNRVKSSGNSLKIIHQDYIKISHTLDHSKKSLADLSDRFDRGSAVLNNVRALYLAAEQKNYTSISGIKIDNKSFLELFLDQQVGDIISVFQGLDVVTQVFNDSRKVISSVDDFFEAFNEMKFMGNFDFFEKLTDTEVFKTFKMIKYIADGEKLGRALYEGNLTDVGELISKYYDKGATELIKVSAGASGFAALCYFKLGSNLGENIGEEILMIGSPSRMGIAGAAAAAWNMTGNVVVESASEIAWEIVDNGAKLFNIDLDKVYEELTGTPGIEGFYKSQGMLFNEVTKYWGSKFADWF